MHYGPSDARMDRLDLISALLHPIRLLAGSTQSNLGRPSGHRTARNTPHLSAQHPSRFRL